MLGAPVVCACVHVCREVRSWNKGSILKCTVDYVRRLQTQRRSLFAMLEKNRQLELSNQQLKNEFKVSLSASFVLSVIKWIAEVNGILSWKNNDQFRIVKTRCNKKPRHLLSRRQKLVIARLRETQKTFMFIRWLQMSLWLSAFQPQLIISLYSWTRRDNVRIISRAYTLLLWG